MFASCDQTPAKKTFQKPNILRRKPKVTPVRAGTCKPLGAQPLPNTSTASLKPPELGKDKTDKNIVIRRPPQRLQLDINVEKNVASTFNTISIVEESNLGELEHSTGQNPVNVEAFLNGSQQSEFKTQNESTNTNIVSHSEQKWQIDFIDESDKMMIIEPFEGSQLSLEEKAISVAKELSTAETSTSGQQETENNVPSVVSHEEVPNEQYIARAAKFKCDAPDCDKKFSTEQKLKRHKSIHNKAPRHTTVECPVKKTDEAGVEKSCGRIFHVREELAKHLNEDHTLDDAPHRCEECGRRFFWATGLRAHGRAHWSRLARAPLACGWPGCGRAFRQPCRLREHARAHTGDKPYPCRYPNCGWSFRTASKLLRHARRHTGERRHLCACGRAFLRREHLREHQARHAPQPRQRHHCTHSGCTQSFNNMSSLYLHMKKVHKKEEDEVAPNAEVTEVSTIALTDLDNNMFMVSFLPESGEAAAESPAAAAAASSPEREWHAARTHCTWPLAPRAPAYDDGFVLEDAHVEQSESSESNIYTVRSDLFLHGNLLHSEDSQQMGSSGTLAGAAGAAGGAGGAPPASPPHADLPLLDTHSTIDLMQEELMYTDAGVDESSFQVLLLSGEELG